MFGTALRQPTTQHHIPRPQAGQTGLAHVKDVEMLR
jgi:hypothetical protein